jgi:hypothetical protein
MPDFHPLHLLLLVLLAGGIWWLVKGRNQS